ncbi:MAG: hypothetical protein VX701_00840 [Chloroflexota bacterium]|nr:hypothetical protein [Chloroflexota bacterium]
MTKRSIHAIDPSCHEDMNNKWTVHYDTSLYSIPLVEPTPHAEAVCVKMEFSGTASFTINSKSR